MEEYIVQMIMATRYGIEGDSDIKHWLSFGASPRGTISLDRCARAHAWLQGKDYVSPDDVQAIAKEVLRHRIILSFEAEANDISADDVIDRIIQLLPVT
jgi:MoxR-like ATPase